MLKEDYKNDKVKTIQYAYIYYDKNGKELAYSIPGSEIEFSSKTTEEDKKTIYNDCGSHLNFIRIINKKIKKRINFSEEEKANYYVGRLAIAGLPIYSFDGINMPEVVNGDFNCSNNELTSLKGAPEKINGHFVCSGNKLTSLEGCSKKIEGSFFCSRNQLKNLIGGPKMVGIDYCCNSNELTSLEGAPEKINGNFDCSYNKISKEELLRYLKTANINGGVRTDHGNFSTQQQAIEKLNGQIKESYFGY